MDIPAKDKHPGAPSMAAKLPPLSREAIEALDFSDLSPGRDAEDPSLVREEGFFTAPDGQQLFWRSWHAEALPRRGTVALVHGYGEHCTRYDHVAAALVRAGYNVMAIDVRGHGRSTGVRAFVRRYDDYVDDMALLKRKVEQRWPGLPLFCLGHSNGGLITLRYALTHPAGVRGFVVTSPLCGLKVQVPFVKALAGDVMSKIWPTLALPSELDPCHLTHVEDVVTQYADDPLVLKVANARWFTEAKAAFVDTLARANEIDQPFLFLVAGADEIVDPTATERIFHRLSSADRELEIFPDLYHEILNETVWDDLMRRIIAWMEKHRVDAP